MMPLHWVVTFAPARAIAWSSGFEGLRPPLDLFKNLHLGGADDLALTRDIIALDITDGIPGVLGLNVTLLPFYTLGTKIVVDASITTRVAVWSISSEISYIDCPLHKRTGYHRCL
jgi:hypothetical protein